MKFGAVAPKAAIGGTAVHTIRQGAMVLKKGTLIGPVEAAAFDAAGIKEIVVARLEAGGGSQQHSPSVATLRKYAQAVGCRLEIRLRRRKTK